MTNVTNSEDIIDSRDVIARIEELEDSLPENAHETMPGTADELEDIKEELKTLKALAEEANGSPDWQYGETLIRDSYFQTYAQELSEDYGDLDRPEVRWPYTCIDWEWATRELKTDYFNVDFDGVDYWIRS
jgi:hypothetical protein